MKASARNQLKGDVVSVVHGAVMSKVTVQVGDNVIVSVITRDAAEDLGLAVGDAVYVVVKATDVMVVK